MQQRPANEEPEIKKLHDNILASRVWVTEARENTISFDAKLTWRAFLKT